MVRRALGPRPGVPAQREGADVRLRGKRGFSREVHRLSGMQFGPRRETPTGSRQNTLYVAGQNGDQAWAFTVSYDTDQLVLSPLAEYYPFQALPVDAGSRGLLQ